MNLIPLIWFNEKRYHRGVKDYPVRLVKLDT